MSLPKIYKPKSNYKLIRLGKDHDGGYLVGQKSILNSKNLISFGISDDWSFEYQFSKMNKNTNIYAFDDMIDLKWLFKKFLKDIKHFIFFEIQFKTLINSFLKIIQYNFVKNKINLIKKFISQNDISEITKDKKNIFFKIDIEGSEYRILDEIIKIKEKIEAIVIELHDIDLHKDRIKNFIQKIDLNVTHIHPNNYSRPDSEGNPTCIELTIERNSEKENLLELELPHILDQRCDPKSEDFILNFENN